ncbi:MAG: hypothetical protein ACLQPH_11290 [Acidimicrobiales bacterium]
MAARTVTPEEFAVVIAEDRHLAVEFHQYRALGDTADALQLVTELATEILAHSRHAAMGKPAVHDRSLLTSVSLIEEVAVRSDQRGDEVQASWCRSLCHVLAGGE